MNYFGKPRECYKCHIKSVHESWSRLYEQKESMIKNLCDQYDIPIERFKASSLLSVAFHDAGKLSLRFQQEMYGIAIKNKWANPHVICQKCSSSIITPSQDRKTEPYRHEIISGFASLYLSSILDDKYGKLSRIDFPFEFFAVLGHHKPVNPDIFRREWNRFYGESDELEMVGYGGEQWNYVMDVAKTLFEAEGMIFPFIEWEDIHDKSSIIGVVKDNVDTIPFVVQDIIDNFGDTKVLGEIRETLAVLKSLLVAADWEGSSEKQIHSSLNRSPDDFWDVVKKKIEENPGKTFKIKDFQQNLTELSGHGIAVAPTGSGKTEGAIGWALKNISLNGKILYVLPNQTLTNSIYERIGKYFGKEKVGLLHSGAQLYQILSRFDSYEPEQYDMDDFAPTDDEKYLHTLNRMMFRPIMVTTVDQLLMIAFNGNKRWSVVMGEIMGGAIIFDEVHAYDGHMLALLERITRELRNHTKMLFMSATMPLNLISFLSKLLDVEGNSHVVNDNTLLEQARNEYLPVISNKGIFEPLIQNKKLSKKAVEIITQSVEQGKRILIVCNTVKNAQDAYLYLKNELNLENNNIMCLHSRFIAKDRRTKEKTLEKDEKKSRDDQLWPKILVATQVIECGMDIDYDVFLTEGAPLEAIIQRAGRVNRERNSQKGKVFVFKQDEGSQKFYPPEITENALKTLKEKAIQNPEITEAELIDLIEVIYKNNKFEEDPRFLNTRRVLDDLIYDIGAVQDLPETDLHTRFVTYKMVEVIPEVCWDNIEDKNQFVIMEHLVKMPLWAYLFAKKEKANSKWKVMDMLYDDEIGGTFENNILSKVESGVLFT